LYSNGMNPFGPSSALADTATLSVQQARAAIGAALRPAVGLQAVALHDALGRVLAADVLSPIAVPAHDNAAMDGFAFDGGALDADSAVALRVVGSVLAGAPFGRTLQPGEAVRIMTGAVMPDGADTVLPQELSQWTETQVRFDAKAVARGAHRRRRGEDLAPGAVALRAGRVLTPADLGLMASLGMVDVGVRRRLRVALFSTGNELREAGQRLEPGCIHDSNRASLRAALQRLGVEVIDLGLVRDEPAALRATLHEAAVRADAVLSSGGVSVGDADHMRGVLAELGRVEFWHVAMRPGRPFAFGHLRAADKPVWLFALPGNPVAALVSFYVFVRDAVLQLAGAQPNALPLLSVPSRDAIAKRPGRTEFLRAEVRYTAGAGWQAQPAGAQGSGQLHSMSAANALIVLASERGPVAAGEPVEVWLFDGLT
jgi:molybdopterin molybdotransferase